MLAQIFEGRSRGPAACTTRGGLGGQNLNRAVHADLEDLIHLGQVGVKAAMLDIRPVTANARLDQNAILRMRTNRAGQ